MAALEAAPEQLFWLTNKRFTSSAKRFGDVSAPECIWILTRPQTNPQKGWCAQVTTGNLERVRKVKTRHQRLWTRVVTVREELQARRRPPARQPHPRLLPLCLPVQHASLAREHCVAEVLGVTWFALTGPQGG